MKNILITGGTGFLGSHLVRRLLAEHCELIVLKRSTSKVWRIKGELPQCKVYNSDEISLPQIFRENKISVIFHCATDYGTSSDITDIVAANLLLPLQLCELGIRHHAPYFINTDTVLGKRINAYALSKKQFSEWMPYFSQNGLVCVNMALEHFYGPFDNKTKFVSRMIADILSDKDRIALTAGKQKRDFIFIDDVIEAFAIVYRNLNQLKPNVYSFEVGTNCNTTIEDLLQKIKAIAGNTRTILDFGAIPYREHEVMESQVDTRSLRALGWSPRVSLEEGLTKTIEMELAQRIGAVRE